MDANGWLGLIEPATLHATRPGSPDRPAWTRLAVAALDTARLTGALTDREVATRMAHLCRALARHGAPETFDEALAPDRVARTCLALTGMTAAEASSTPWRPRAGDVAVMRALRRVRTLVAPAVALADQVEDAATRRELAAWADALPRLP